MKRKQIGQWALFGIFVICFWHPVESVAQSAAPNDLQILSLPPLVLDAATDSGSLLLHLQNQGAAPRTVALSTGNFLNRSTHQEWGAGVTFSAPGATERNLIYKKELAAGAVETVAVYVSKIWEAGESVAELLDQGKPIGQLKVLKINPAFNVTLLNQAPDKTVLAFERAQPLELILKNDDGMTYPLIMELRLEGQTFPFSGVTLPPRSSAALTIQLPPAAYKRTLAELFNKPLSQKGTLLLKLSPPTTLATGPWPIKTIPIEARLSAWSPQWRPVWSMLIIFIVLFLGGICSLVLSAWIPNQRRRLDLKEQLSQLAGQIREISSQIDSALRVAVRMERHRLYKLLFSRWILTPDISVLFNKCSQGIATLDRRIQILVQLDRTYEMVKARYASKTPPSLIDDIEETLDRATQLLKKTEPRDIDLQTAQEWVDGADSLLEKIDQPNPQLKETLLSRLSELQSEYKQNPDVLMGSSTAKRFQKNLPGFFQVLEGTVEITDLYRLDSALLKWDLIKRYLLWHINQPNSEEAAVQKNLIDLLRQESREALRSARLLVRQMEEGITQDSLQKEMTEPNKIFLKLDPEVARANQPLKFKASFSLPRFNQAAVRERFICDWTFKHDNMTLTENGWAVSHYFPNPGNVTVTLGFRTLDGQILTTQTAAAPETQSETQDKKTDTEVILSRTVQVLADESLKSPDRFKVELLYLGIVLGGTLLGLMAGAKDKLMELDVAPGLIAVFLLGFGADTIKNLLTQRQAQQ